MESSQESISFWLDSLSRNKVIFKLKNLFIVLFLINSHKNFPVLFLSKELCFQSLNKEHHGLVDWGLYPVPGKINDNMKISLVEKYLLFSQSDNSPIDEIHLRLTLLQDVNTH